jgi:hypothetical protein
LARKLFDPASVNTMRAIERVDCAVSAMDDASCPERASFGETGSLLPQRQACCLFEAVKGCCDLGHLGNLGYESDGESLNS